MTPDDVMDLVADRLLELQVDQGLPVHVVPLRTPARTTAIRQPQHPRKPYAAVRHGMEVTHDPLSKECCQHAGSR